MKILDAQQKKAADRYTIDNEPIKSIDLMERASKVCANWIIENFSTEQQIHVICGTGNNGGDGLAGDLAAKKFGEEAMKVVDIVDSIGEAFRSFEYKKRFHEKS